MNDEKFNLIFPFKEPRRLQKTVINKIIDSYEDGYKHIVLQAPTGVGKSVIAMAVANYFLDDSEYGKSSYVLTSQKMLQDQYTTDFHIPTVYGRANYKCNGKNVKKSTCDKGTCKRKGWTLTEIAANCPNCPYYMARNKAYAEPITILNYAYFLQMRDNNELQPQRKLLILDECHNVESQLLNISTIRLTDLELNFMGLYGDALIIPDENQPRSSKLKWLFNIVKPQIKDTLKLCTNNEIVKANKLNSCLQCINILGEELLNRRPCVITHDKKAIEYKPVFGRALAERFLLPSSDLTLSMSATVLSKEQYCRQVGIKKEETMFFKLPSLFPVENRPIRFTPIGSMSYKNKHQTKPHLLTEVKKLLDTHKHQRGIIHTTNYEIASYLMENISSNRLVLPKGATRDKQIKYFMNSDRNDLVLISPSLQEGIDLKDDLSRFTIVCKLPYASLADPWVKKRMELSPNWYSEATITNLVQSTGRSVRTEDDYAETYILDSDFEWFYKQNKNKFPTWWKESLVF